MIRYTNKIAFTILAAILILLPQTLLAQWNLEADYSLTDNPNGVWSYGYFDTLNNFTLYEYCGTSNDGAGNVSAGWRAPSDWDTHGNLAFNYGPNAITGWTSYREVGEIAGGPPSIIGEKAGARWTAPYTALFRFHVKFIGKSTKPAGTTVDTYLIHNTENIKTGRVAGFVGRAANNFSDAYGENPVVEWIEDFTVNAGETVSFAFDHGIDATNSADACGLTVEITPLSNVSLVQGIVVDANTSVALEGAEITIGDDTAVTKANGTYLLVTDPGTHTMTVTMGGYDTYTTTVTIIENETTTENVALTPKTVFTTYYVNASTGNDSNDGLTPETAWKSLNNGSDLNVLSPGDTVIATGTFDSVNLTNRNNPAKSFAPITFRGNNAMIKPSNIDAACISLTSKLAHHIVIDGFDLSYARYGLYVVGGANNITLTNSYIHRISCNVGYEGAGVWDQGVTNHSNTYYRNVFKAIGTNSSGPQGCITIGEGHDINVWNNSFNQATNAIRTWAGATNISFVNNICTEMWWAAIHSDGNALNSITNSYNLFNANGSNYSNNTAGEGEFTADPKYVGSPVGMHAFELQDSSPAIEAGTYVGMDDFLGFAPDIGAFESDAGAEAGFISGTVIGTSQYTPNNTLLAGARVVVNNGEYSGVTSSKGTFRIPVLPGTYTISASYDGYDSDEYTVTVVTGEATTQNIIIDLGIGRIFYVSPDGSDFDNGKAPHTAWQTINNGDLLNVIRPGDVIEVLNGFYQQYDGHGVWLMNCDGTDLQPIVYHANGSVLIDQQGMDAAYDNTMLSCIFADVSHVIFDGFELCNSQFGIYLVDNNTGNTVANCIIHNMNKVFDDEFILHRVVGGIVNSVGKDCTIINNLFYNMGSEDDLYAAAILNPAANGVKIYNNTFDNCWSTLYSWGAAPLGIDFKNNIVTNMRGYGIYADWAQSVTHDYNLFHANANDFSDGLTAAANEVFANPMFINGYELSSISPAIDAGCDVNIAFAGTAPDIGWWESDYPSPATDPNANMNFVTIKGVALGSVIDNFVSICDESRVFGYLAYMEDNTSITAGTRVELKAQLTDGIYKVSEVISANPGEALKPLGMTSQSFASTRPANIPVRVWGYVMASTDDHLTIDDGTGNKIDIYYYTANDTEIGAFIIADGAARCTESELAVVATSIHRIK